MLSYLLRKLGYVSLKEHDLVIDRDGRARPRMVELPTYSFADATPAKPVQNPMHSQAKGRPRAITGAVPEIGPDEQDDTEFVLCPPTGAAVAHPVTDLASGSAPVVVPASPWDEPGTDPGLEVESEDEDASVDVVLGPAERIERPVIEELPLESPEDDEWEWRMAVARAKAAEDTPTPS
jgi:hypothetical protein